VVKRGSGGERLTSVPLPVLIFSLLAPAFGPYTVRYDVHRFLDCNAAALYAAAHPTVGRYESRVAARFEHAWVAPVAPGSFRAQAHIKYALENSQLKLPQWSWSRMTAAQRRAYADFVANLKDHELGHRAIAQAAARERVGSITVLARSTG